MTGFEILGLTGAVKTALCQLDRPDLAETIESAAINWGMCPRHGRFSDGLIIRRFGDSDEPERPDLSDPDMRHLGQAIYIVYSIIRRLLGEPPLDGISEEQAKHLHCLN